jgi:hypothetical protein
MAVLVEGISVVIRKDAIQSKMTLATPAGRRFEGSLSDKFQFIPDDATRH